MDKHLGKPHPYSMTYYITSNMRPIIGSPIPRRVLAGLCGEELRLERLDDTMLAEVPDVLTHNLR